VDYGGGVLDFSVRFTGTARVTLWFTLVATTILAVALNALLWSAEAGGPDAEVATWGLRAIGLLFLVGVLRVLGTLRFDVRLVGWPAGPPRRTVAPLGQPAHREAPHETDNLATASSSRAC
jgi:hypothetical protein